MTERYHKLVRDGIPALIEAQGDRPRTRVLGDAEYAEALREKLAEEAQEYLEAAAAREQAEELADLLEVVYALGALQGLAPQQLEALRADKHAKRGGFAARLMLEEVERHGDAE